MILILDNYDGCANNIYQLAGQLNPDIKIIRNDQIDAQGAARLAPSHIILSGGSAAPEQAGNAMKILKEFAGKIPVLGICLGYRIICAAYGGKSVQMDEIRQGKRELVHVLRDSPIFRGLPEQFYAGFYHSETVPEENIPKEFSIVARSEQDIVGIEWREKALYGLQFHPESFLSEYGREMMGNFLQIALPR